MVPKSGPDSGAASRIRNQTFATHLLKTGTNFSAAFGSKSRIWYKGDCIFGAWRANWRQFFGHGLFPPLVVSSTHQHARTHTHTSLRGHTTEAPHPLDHQADDGRGCPVSSQHMDEESSERERKHDRKKNYTIPRPRLEQHHQPTPPLRGGGVVQKMGPA